MSAASLPTLAPSLEAQTTPVVVAFGDSITQGFGDDGISCDGAPGGYPPRLRSRLSSRGLETEMRISAVCGELTSEGLTRLDGVLANNADARVIILMEATNDLSSPSISTQSMLFNLQDMVEKSLAAGIRPVLSSVVPRAPEAGSNARTGFLTSLLMDYARDAAIDFADPYNALIGIRDLYDRFYAEPFHPNAAGYGLVADALVEATTEALDRPVTVEPCVSDATTLCLNQGRFEVTVEWRDFEDNEGVGQAVELTSDTGYFWFFGPDNIELVLKVLDGQANNGNFWVFYGALSTVEYTITVIDTETARRRIYRNPENNLASVGDTEAFPGDPDEEDEGSSLVVPAVSAIGLLAGEGSLLRPARPAEIRQIDVSAMEEGMTCVEDAETLCLNDDRFQIRSTWLDFADQTGVGMAEELTPDTGYFWFFGPDNVEVMIKVLDGRENNGNFWVFYGALSSVQYDIEVTDVETGRQVIYRNPLDNFGSQADTEAFPEPTE
ncbi:MAG: GDSL-type esterase/lipase family protein [Acidobacteriota bacterium]